MYLPTYTAGLTTVANLGIATGPRAQSCKPHFQARTRPELDVYFWSTI